MFKYIANFPYHLIQDSEHLIKYHSARKSVMIDPDSIHPLTVLKCTDEWNEWASQIFNKYWIDSANYKIHFESKEDYTMFILAWGDKQ